MVQCSLDCKNIEKKIVVCVFFLDQGRVCVIIQLLAIVVVQALWHNFWWGSGVKINMLLRKDIFSVCMIIFIILLEEIPPAEPQTRPTCGSNEATCANGQCISRSKVCDGNFDCTDGSDERSCSKFLFSGEVSYFFTFLGKKI